jgi:glycopeptide antibiotics resistance protein
MLTGADLTAWALLLATPVMAVVLWRGRHRWQRALTLTGLAVYASALVGLALGGIPVDQLALHELGRAPRLGRVNLMPFWFVDNLVRDPSWTVVFHTIGNLLLMTPLGFLLPLLWERFRRLGAMAVAGFLTSLTIEASQLAISTLLGHTYRLFEVDDLMLNTSGAVLGWLMWRTWARRSTTRWATGVNPADPGNDTHL